MSEEVKTFTQEELDEVIKERLGRAEKKHADEIAKKDAEIEKLNKSFDELKSKYAGYDDEKAKSSQEIEELKAQIKGYENASAKRKIADEIGLDSKALEFITGETEEEMKESAEKLKALTGTSVPPLATKETGNLNKVDSAFKELNDKLKGGI